MIQLSTLKTCLQGIISDPENQIVTGAGYNAIVEMVMNRQEHFPCIVLEEQDGGILSIQPGGFDKYPQSIWVLDRCASDENPEQYYTSTKQLLKEVAQSEVNILIANLLTDRLPSVLRFPFVKFLLELDHVYSTRGKHALLKYYGAFALQIFSNKVIRYTCDRLNGGVRINFVCQRQRAIVCVDEIS